MDEQGGGIAPALEEEIASIDESSMEDTFNEGPHAKAARICQASRRGTWPYQSSSCTLDQNLGDSGRLAVTCGADLDMECQWC